jgi:hypothetical protein
VALTLGLVVGACGLLTFAAVASAHHAKTKTASKQELCSAFLSTSIVSGIVGGSTSLNVNPDPLRHGGVYIGDSDGGRRLPGSTCTWSSTNAVAVFTSCQCGDGAGSADLTVGYGETASGWSRLVSYFQAGAPDGFPAGTTPAATYTPLTPPDGLKAFLVTVSWAQYYGYTPSEWATQVPGYSPYENYVTVLTPRHDIIQLSFGNTAASVAEDEAIQIAQTHSKSI